MTYEEELQKLKRFRNGSLSIGLLTTLTLLLAHIGDMGIETILFVGSVGLLAFAATLVMYAVQYGKVRSMEGE